MIEAWERRHDESWVDRWYRLTGRSPKSDIKTTKHITGSATVSAPYRTLRDDAATRHSRSFRNE